MCINDPSHITQARGADWLITHCSDLRAQFPDLHNQIYRPDGCFNNFDSLAERIQEVFQKFHTLWSNKNLPPQELEQLLDAAIEEKNSFDALRLLTTIPEARFYAGDPQEKNKSYNLLKKLALLSLNENQEGLQRLLQSRYRVLRPYFVYSHNNSILRRDNLTVLSLPSSIDAPNSFPYELIFQLFDEITIDDACLEVFQSQIAGDPRNPSELLEAIRDLHPESFKEAYNLLPLDLKTAYETELKHALENDNEHPLRLGSPLLAVKVFGFVALVVLAINCDDEKSFLAMPQEASDLHKNYNEIKANLYFLLQKLKELLPQDRMQAFSRIIYMVGFCATRWHDELKELSDLYRSSKESSLKEDSLMSIRSLMEELIEDALIVDDSSNVEDVHRNHYLRYLLGLEKTYSVDPLCHPDIVLQQAQNILQEFRSRIMVEKLKELNARSVVFHEKLVDFIRKIPVPEGFIIDDPLFEIDWNNLSEERIQSICQDFGIHEPTESLEEKRQKLRSLIIPMLLGDAYHETLLPMEGIEDFVYLKLLEQVGLLDFVDAVSLDDFISSFIFSYFFHNFEDFQKIVQSERFREIPIEEFIDVFDLLAEKGDIDLITVLMQSKRFKEIPATHLGTALISFVNYRDFDLMQLLVQSKRFKEIDAQYLEHALYYACNLEKPNPIIKLLVTNISTEKLSEVFSFFFQNQYRIYAKLMIKHLPLEKLLDVIALVPSLINEVVPKKLWEIFSYAALNGREDIVELLIQNVRIDKLIVLLAYDVNSGKMNIKLFTDELTRRGIVGLNDLNPDQMTIISGILDIINRERDLSSFKTEEIISLVRSLGYLNILDSELFTAISFEIRRRDLSELKPIAIVDLFLIFGKLHIADSRLFEVLSLEVRSRGLSDFKPKEIRNLAWSFTYLGFADRELLTAISLEVKNRPFEDFKPEEIIDLVKSFVVLGCYDKELFAFIFHELINSHFSNDVICQCMANIFYALTYDVVKIKPLNKPQEAFDHCRDVILEKFREFGGELREDGLFVNSFLVLSRQDYEQCVSNEVFSTLRER